MLIEIRGQSISYSTYIKKQKTNREEELKTLIKTLEDKEDSGTCNIGESNCSVDELKKELEKK